ncbi:unnamed protein product [Effrenium voratum]|nr:unnamed protein product [Effrenium voratum]
MDDAFSSYTDTDGDSEAAFLSDGQKSGEEGAGCCRCCWCCCKASTLLVLLLCAGWAFRQPLAAHLARRGVAAAELEVFSVSIDGLGGGKLRPAVVARVARPSPVDAEVRMSRTILAAEVPSGIVRVGRLELPPLQVRAWEDLWLNLTAEVSIDNLTAFGLAGQRAVREAESQWAVEGLLEVRVRLWGREVLRLEELPFHRAVKLKGLAGFAQARHPVTILDIKEAEGHPHRLETSVAIQIFNPSNLAASLSDPLQFDITQRNRSFGTALVHGVKLQPGRNAVTARFTLREDAENAEAVRAFVLGYVRHELQTVTMSGSGRSSQDPLLSALLDGLQLPFRVRPPEGNFIRRIEAQVGLVQMQVLAEIANPLPQEIVLGAMDLSIREKGSTGQEIFRLTGNATSGLGGEVLKSKAVSRLRLSLRTMDANLKDFFLVGRLVEDAVDGAAVVGVRGPLAITVRPSFHLMLQYIADNVTAELYCPVVCGSAHSMFNPATWFPSD